MANYTVTTWTELTTVLSNIASSENEVTIIFNGDFGDPDDTDINASFEIEIPYHVTTFILTTTEGTSNIVYKAYIKRASPPTTTDNSILNLTIENINLEVRDNHHVIDIASPIVAGSSLYNSITFKGNNTLKDYMLNETDTKNCGIHVKSNTGLKIISLAGSNTRILVPVVSTILNNIATSAGIGGGTGESSGFIDLYLEGNLEVKVSVTTGDNASTAGAGIGGGSSHDGRAGSVDTINIYGTGTLDCGCSGDCDTGAAIGAGSSYNGKPGKGGTVNIYDNVTVNASSKGNWDSGVGIGGGSSFYEKGGYGGNVNIYDNAIVNIISGGKPEGAAIGGGSSLLDAGGDGGNVKIYNNAQVNITCASDTKGVGIGGGASYMDEDGGNSGFLDIYDDAKVTINVAKDSVGIGSLSPTSSTDIVKIRDRASVTINCEKGIGIEQVHALGITTSNPVNIISSSETPNYAIMADNVTITENGPVNILGGIKGDLLIIHDQELIVNKLDYKSEMYTDGNLVNGLDFDNGYIIVNDKNHTQSPLNRTDYFRYTYLLNNMNYLGHIKLKNAANVSLEEALYNNINTNLHETLNKTQDETLDNELDSDLFETLDSDSDVDITLNSDGVFRGYLSTGEYFFTTSPSDLYKTVNIVSPNVTAGETPVLEFIRSLSKVIGSINISGNLTHDERGIKVELYDSDLNSTGFSALTDENGDYTINNTGIGDHYLYISNIPNDYTVRETETFNINGLSKESFYINGQDNIYPETAVIEYNEGIIGEPGKDGLDFPSSSIDLMRYENQIVKPLGEVDFGKVNEGSGNSIIYSPIDNTINLKSTGTYLVSFNMNSSYTAPHLNEDYLSLQLKLGNNYVPNSFAYSYENGTLHGMLLLKTQSNISQNKLKLVNVCTHDISIDNFNIIVIRTS